MSVPVALGGGQLTVPYGLAQRELLDNSGLGSIGYSPVLPLGSSTTFQFALPAPAPGGRWTALHLRVSMPSPGRPAGLAGAVTVALFNWNTGRWDTQAGFGAGVNTISQPDAYVDPRGLVRVQFNGGNGQQYLQTLDLDATGAAA
jgi:hypothetical protein